MILDRRDEMDYLIGLAVIQIGIVLCRHLLDHPEVLQQSAVSVSDQELSE